MTRLVAFGVLVGVALGVFLAVAMTGVAVIGTLSGEESSATRNGALAFFVLALVIGAVLGGVGAAIVAVVAGVVFWICERIIPRPIAGGIAAISAGTLAAVLSVLFVRLVNVNLDATTYVIVVTVVAMLGVLLWALAPNAKTATRQS